MSSPTAFAPRQRRLRRLHRWLGVGSLVFVLLLSVTGIALNHTGELGLGQRYMSSSWLLGWYGIEAPAAEASFAVADHRVTLMGKRLYFDAQEIADDVSRLSGAVRTRQFVAVATERDVFLLTPSGALVEQINTVANLPAGIDELGLAGEALVFRSGEGLFQTDEDFVVFSSCGDFSSGELQWSRPSTVSPAELEALQALYRGRGVTVERLLTDLHSGRFFSNMGPMVMDLVGVVFILLSIFGVMVWVRGNGERR